MTLQVLIVDDTRTIRYQLKELLAGRGFDVYEACDGVEALEKIQANKPHILLMDIMMPNMDGIECCRRIKSNPRLKDIKVVMVTTKGEYAKVNEAFKAGCDDYITKPIQPTEFGSKVDEISKMVQTRMTLQSL